MLKKIAGIAFFFSITAMLLAGVGFLVLHFSFPPAKVTMMTRHWLRASIYRDIKLESVALFPRGRIAGFALSEPLGFKDGVFFSVREIRFVLKWLTLLRHRIVIDEVVIDSPRLVLSQDGTGTFNSENLFIRAGGGTPRPSYAYAPADFLVLAARIDGGELVFKSAKLRGIEIVVRDIECLVNNLSFGSPSRFNLSGHVTAGKDTYALTAEGSFNLHERTLTIDQAALAGNSGSLETVGTLRRLFDTEPPLFDLIFSGDTSLINDMVAPFLPGPRMELGMPRLTLHLSGTPGDLNVEAARATRQIEKTLGKK